MKISVFHVLLAASVLVGVPTYAADVAAGKAKSDACVDCHGDVFRDAGAPAIGRRSTKGAPWPLNAQIHKRVTGLDLEINGGDLCFIFKGVDLAGSEVEFYLQFLFGLQVDDFTRCA